MITEYNYIKENIWDYVWEEYKFYLDESETKLHLRKKEFYYIEDRFCDILSKDNNLNLSEREMRKAITTVLKEMNFRIKQNHINILKEKYKDETLYIANLKESLQFFLESDLIKYFLKEENYFKKDKNDFYFEYCRGVLQNDLVYIINNFLLDIFSMASPLINLKIVDKEGYIFSSLIKNNPSLFPELIKRLKGYCVEYTKFEEDSEERDIFIYKLEKVKENINNEISNILKEEFNINLKNS